MGGLMSVQSRIPAEAGRFVAVFGASGHTGRDIYAFTAPLVVEAAQRILEGAADGVGVLAPGEVFDAPAFLRALAPEHLAFEMNSV
jgi:hypothetical protein